MMQLINGIPINQPCQRNADHRLMLQVWRPDQDAVRKIQDLERQCINISMNLDLEVAKVREQLLIEKLSARNFTARVIQLPEP